MIQVSKQKKGSSYLLIKIKNLSILAPNMKAPSLRTGNMVMAK